MVTTCNKSESGDSEEEREYIANLYLMEKSIPNSKVSDSKNDSDDEGGDEEKVMSHLLTFPMQKIPKNLISIVNKYLCEAKLLKKIINELKMENLSLKKTFNLVYTKVKDCDSMTN